LGEVRGMETGAPAAGCRSHFTAGKRFDSGVAGFTVRTMPYLKIQTSVALADHDRSVVAIKASKLMSQVLGKSEDYVMVAVEDAVKMLFAGGDGAAAYFELHSIGLSAEQARESVGELCRLAGESLGVAADRVYVNCRDAERTMWGWNGDTFG
jgi:phenylpyruvate tautomerase